MGLSSGERILLFLSTARPVGDPFGSFDQEAISRECGIGRTHIPRSIKPLVERGLVAEEKGRAPGRNRTVKRYAITLEGQREAAVVAERINAMKVSLIGPDGLKNTTDPHSILSLANAYLARASRSPLCLSLLLSIDADALTWDSVLELADSREYGGEVDLPAGWRAIDTPEDPTDYIRRPKEESALSEMLGSDDPTIVEGRAGSGRRTLLSHVLRQHGFRALWIMRGEGRPPNRVRTGSDLLVMVDDMQPDPSSLLFRESRAPTDPRDMAWDESLRAMKLVIVRKNGSPLDAATVSVGPLETHAFAAALEGTGLDGSAMKAIHTAANGSPAAVRYLKRMDPTERAKLSGPGSEEALFKMLLELGRSKGASKDS